MKDQGTPTHDFASVTDFNNLYQSFTEARKGKRWKYSVCKYEANVLENLLFIQVMLQRHKYRLSPYNCFYVHEPKERLIMYNSFRDKIVQHCLCEQVLEPLLSKTFIYDNYASQKGKGTHFGLDRLKSFMAAYPVAYKKGNIRRYGSDLYRCNQDHTSQADWTPAAAASLWTKIGDPTEEWPEWSQPVGAHDAYDAGAKVSHNGKHWTSDVASNVWEPGVYGWTEVTA